MADLCPGVVLSDSTQAAMQRLETPLPTSDQATKHQKTKTKLSPAALKIWEAFNEDEAGVFVDYGNKLAAALRAAAQHCVPDDSEGHWVYIPNLLAIADELDRCEVGIVDADGDLAEPCSPLTGRAGVDKAVARLYAEHGNELQELADG